MRLVDEVAVVDVDRGGPELERGEERLEVLGAVGHVDRHLVAGGDAVVAQERSEARRTIVECAEGDPPVAADEGVTVGDRLSDAVPEVREVPVGHCVGGYAAAGHL